MFLPGLLQRRVRALAAVMLLLGTIATPALAAASWSATATHAMPPGEWVDRGALPAGTPIHVTVALRLRDRSGLDDFIAHLTSPGDPLFGRYLTPQQFIARYAPTRAAAQSVADYLAGRGFTRIEIAPNRLLVTAEGTAGAASAAFGTRLHRFALRGRSGYGNVADAQLPAALARHVVAVLGLQNLAQEQTLVEQARTGDAASTPGYDPLTLAALYDADGLPPASDTEVAIAAFGDLRQTIADLRQFESDNGLPEVPVQQVFVGGRSFISLGSAEWNLDSQMIQAMAGGSLARLTFYVGNPLTAQRLGIGFLTPTFNRAVSDGTAKVINVSLGSCESLARLQGVAAADDQIFAEGVAQGQTFVVASGDGGSNAGCLLHSGLFVATTYPASSPYVVAVGGTTLKTTTPGGGSYVSESAWPGGGGGFSRFEPAPSWQQPVTGVGTRSVPDLAFDADPESGAVILVRGQALTVGGTSMAAPMFSGSYARAQTASGNRLGFAAPLLYRIAEDVPTAFHDITAGFNGEYAAAPGFDQITGWGSPDIGLLVQALTSDATSPPTPARPPISP